MRSIRYSAPAVHQSRRNPGGPRSWRPPNPSKTPSKERINGVKLEEVAVLKIADSMDPQLSQCILVVHVICNMIHFFIFILRFKLNNEMHC